MQIFRFLSNELSVSEQEISDFIVDAPKKYKVYTIPKRTSGTRVIAHPAKRLKDYQRAVVKFLEQKIPVHDSAYAYKKNVSIKENAKAHQKFRYLLKMDFQNFFYSIKPDLFFSVLEKHGLMLSDNDCYVLTQILFFCPSKRTNGKLVLSIGAPSSPLVSNCIMFFFDKELTEICLAKGVCYTRYADDLTFSTNQPSILFALPDLVKKLLAGHFYQSITVNERKTVFSSKAHNRHVTGVTINNDGRLSLGRKKKRYISSLIHRFTLNQLGDDDINYLKGLLAFAFYIEPVFKQRMVNKYSAQTIRQIITTVRGSNEKK